MNSILKQPIRILGSLLLCALVGCASSSTTSSTPADGTDQNNGQPVRKGVRTAARAVVMKVAGTPVKVVTAAGTAAEAVEKKIDSDQQ